MNIGNMAKGMNDVERLAIDHGGASLLVPDRNGEFIRYTDYAALQQQLAAAREALEKAYEYGWRHAAYWAECEDLLSDIGSQAYELDKQSIIATLQRDRQP